VSKCPRALPALRDGFRETFLVRFTRKRDVSALRRLGLLVSELYVNAAPRWWPYHPEGDMRAMLNAVVLDLRQARDELAWVTRGERYDPGEVALAELANRSAEEVERIAAAIEGAVESSVA
jgi:hypothetical protein